MMRQFYKDFFFFFQRYIIRRCKCIWKLKLGPGSKMCSRKMVINQMGVQWYSNIAFFALPDVMFDL